MAQTAAAAHQDLLDSLQQKPLSELCCVNPLCPDRGKKDAGNLKVRTGKGGGVWRILRCSTCQEEFSERKGTALWGSRMPLSKAVAIVEHLKEGNGIRRTARLTRSSKDGVTSMAIRAGLHAHAMHEECAVHLRAGETQFDEKWSYVYSKKGDNEQNGRENDGIGEQWDHTAIDVDSRFVVSLVMGKRNSETLKKVVSDFAKRTDNVPPPLVTTDDCNTYRKVLIKQYGETVHCRKTGKRRRARKASKRWPEGSVYATVCKKYRKNKVVSVKRKVVHGTEQQLEQALKRSKSSKKVNTSFVERQNGTDRHHNARKARKTYEFSKVFSIHLVVTWLVLVCYNFSLVHAGLRICGLDGLFYHRTPAMAIGIAAHPLTVAEILTTQVVGFELSKPKELLKEFAKEHGVGPAP